jgi:flagellar biosynthesis protein FlhB
MSHYAVTEIVSRSLGLSGWQLILAYIFGVLVDLDHFLIKGVRQNLGHIFKSGFNKTFPRGFYNKTFIQEPIFIIILWIFGIFIHNFIPAIFLSIHWLMDSLCRFEKRPLAPFSKKLSFRGFLEFNTRIEYIISVIVALTLLIWRLITGFGF